MLYDVLKLKSMRFLREEEGSIAVEALLSIMLLFWSLMAGYTYFDGYRQSAANVKAAYTIGDLISRETRTIDDSYIDSMVDLFQLMVNDSDGVQMRISLVRYDEGENEYSVRWSSIRGFTQKLTDGNIDDIRDKLPPMSDQDTIILVETYNVYEGAFDIGLGDVEMKNFVFTRPRFTNEIAGSV